MAIGTDKQYDLSWEEQDKIRRRLELKDRLKQDGIRRRYNPFFHMKGVLYSDPAVDRYMDLRKKGRMPNAPLRPSIFFSMAATVFIPIFGISYLIKWERSDYLRDCASGDYPLEKRMGKSIN